jgi:hypothetical protein
VSPHLVEAVPTRHYSLSGIRPRRPDVGVRVRIRVEVADGVRSQDASRLTEALARWLEQDRTVGPYVKINRIRSGATDGAMSGELVDWLALVFSSSFSVISLVYSHLSFRASLPPRERSSVRLVAERGDSRVVVEAGSAEEVAQLMRLVGDAGLLDHQAPESTADTASDGGAAGAS